MTTLTDKQRGFITSLITKKYDAETAATVLAEMPWASLTGGRGGTASDLIEKLKGMPDQDAHEVPSVITDGGFRHGVNSSRGVCSTCGHPVDAQAGYYYGPFNTGGSRWQTHHKVNQCPSGPAPTPVTVEEGYYRVGDDVVQIYRTRNGRLAGKRMTADGGFQYEPGLMTVAATGKVIDTVVVAAEQCLRKYGALPGSDELQRIAAKYGVESGNCLFCSRELTDERSNPALGGAGYGPVCAKKYSLPWG